MQYSVENSKGSATYDGISGKCIPAPTPSNCSGVYITHPVPEVCKQVETALGASLTLEHIQGLNLVASEGARGIRNSKYLDLAAKAGIRVSGGSSTNMAGVLKKRESQGGGTSGRRMLLQQEMSNSTNPGKTLYTSMVLGRI